MIISKEESERLSLSISEIELNLPPSGMSRPLVSNIFLKDIENEVGTFRSSFLKEPIDVALAAERMKAVIADEFGVPIDEAHRISIHEGNHAMDDIQLFPDGWRNIEIGVIPTEKGREYKAACNAYRDSYRHDPIKTALEMLAPNDPNPVSDLGGSARMLAVATGAGEPEILNWLLRDSQNPLTLKRALKERLGVE